MVISGIGGTVSLTGGFVTKIKRWSASTVAATQEERVLSASGNFAVQDIANQQVTSRIQFECEITSALAAGFSGLTIPNISGWSVDTECDGNGYAILGDKFTHFTAGYLRGAWQVRALIDSAVAPPAVDTIGSLVFTAGTGLTIQGSGGVAGISRANGQGERPCVIDGKFVSSFTVTALPIAGVAGAVSLGGGSAAPTGSVIVTRASVTIDRNPEGAPVGFCTIEAVVDGELS